MSSQFYENEPQEICSHLSERGLKGIFLPDNLEKHTTKEKGEVEARGRRGGNEKTGMVALLAFILATLEKLLY